MKCTSVIRQLACGNTPDAFDEYLQLGEYTARDCLDNFNKCIIDLYMLKYLRKPALEDVEKIYEVHENIHGFPGAIYRTERTDIGADGMTEGGKQNRNKSKSWKIREIKYRQNITQGNCKGWSKFIKKAMALNLLHQSEDPATMILLSKTAAGVADCDAENGPGNTSTADSVSMTYLIYGIPYVPIGLRILGEEWRGTDTSRTLEVARMKCDTAFEIRRVTRLSEAEILHLQTQFIEPENDSIVAEHGLSSKITQSPGGSSDTSEGFENSGSFKDSGRSDEEYSKDGASPKEGGSETPQVQRSTRESRALWKKAIIEEMVSLEKNQMSSLVILPTGKKASQSLWMFRVKEEQDGGKRQLLKVNDMLVAGSNMAVLNKPNGHLPLVFEMKDRCSKKQVLGYVLTVGVTTIDDVHQVGDEREVEVMRNFNRPPRELITEDGVLPKRGYSQFNDVSLGYLVSKVSMPCVWLVQRVSYVRRYRKSAYQADDLDAYDSDYDKISIAKAVLMANLSSCGLDVLSKVSHSDNTRNDMLNQTVQDTNSSTQQDAMILYVFEQLSHQTSLLMKWWMSKHLDTVLMDKKLQEVWMDK
ncbi:hypothetical protein Tco_0320550 [Tanacetum coccineum]